MAPAESGFGIHIDVVLSGYQRALEDSGSPIAICRELWQEWRSETESILGECVDALHERGARDRQTRVRAREFGVKLALRGISLVELIRAGNLLWNTTLSVLSERLPTDAEGSERIPRLFRAVETLQKSINLRLHAGALAYEDIGRVRQLVESYQDGATTLRFDTSHTGNLSVRERQVLDGVAEGLSNREIGNRLNIAEGTVKRHLRRIFAKLGATSRIDAINKVNMARPHQIVVQHCSPA